MFIKAAKNRIAYKINGYFVIKNFLNNGQQTRLLDYYNSLNLYADARVSSYGVYTNNAKDSDAKKSKEIDTFIQDVCLSSLERHFEDFQVGGGIFLLKGVGEKIVAMHQDWNIVDETVSTSFAVWCPLVDVNENNGCIHVIPGSHKWFNNIRTSNIDSVFMPLDRVDESLVAIPLEKGDAIIFAHNLFHGSYPNKSNATRPTVGLSVMPGDTRQVHFLRDGDQVKLMDSRAGYYLDKLKTGQKDQSQVVSTIPYKEEYLLTEETFWKKYKQSPIKRSIAKLLHFISV